MRAEFALEHVCSVAAVSRHAASPAPSHPPPPPSHRHFRRHVLQVRDEKGRKMSKSLGNVVDPVETIQQYGAGELAAVRARRYRPQPPRSLVCFPAAALEALSSSLASHARRSPTPPTTTSSPPRLPADALRFTLATGTSPGQDISLSLERVNASRNFTNKLWNAGKFVLFNLPEDKVDEAEWQRLAAVDLGAAAAAGSDSYGAAGLALSERWVVGALHAAVRDITAAHER